MTLARDGMLVFGLLCCAVLRSLVPGAAEAPASALRQRLPAVLLGVTGKPLPLGPSEQLLARSPGVALERRAYATTQVALVQTVGLRELHPPRVCLRASGLEVLRRAEEQGALGCVVHLWVKGAAARRPLHFFQTYLRGAEQGLERGRCGAWAETARAAAERLLGGPGARTALQVLDADEDRARQRMRALMRVLPRAAHRRS